MKLTPDSKNRYTTTQDLTDGLCFTLTAEHNLPAGNSGKFAGPWALLSLWGVTCVCFDNAMAESFWSTLKTEFYDRKRWATRDAARKAVAYWIEVVYNRRRRHSALGMVSPVDVENRIGLTTSRKEIAA